MKAITTIVATSSILLCMALEARTPRKTVEKKPAEARSAEEIAQDQMEVFGGYIKDMRKQSGAVYVITTQGTNSIGLIREAVELFSEKVCVPVKIESGTFDLSHPEIKAQATIFVVDDPNLPISLIAPEARWAVVNLRPLATDKAAFFEARVKKEVYRTFFHLLGASCSKWPSCPTSCVTKPEDLDMIPKITFPVEFKERFNKYLPGLGITPWKNVTYQKAVQEGWAPKPANKWQKEIWNKVHEPPSNPIKIKYNPATDGKDKE